MAEPVTFQEANEGSTSTVTVVETDEHDAQEIPRVTLKLRKPKTDRKVQWTTGTVDNEHMNKKKSKCCCIYDKPRKFGESSSDDSDEECGNCHGHVEKKKKNKSAALPGSSEGDSSSTIAVDSSQTVTIDN